MSCKEKGTSCETVMAAAIIMRKNMGDTDDYMDTCGTLTD